MVYAGVDLHKRYSVITVVDQSGSILDQQKLNNDKDEIKNFFKDFKDDVEVVAEATSNWYWFSDLLAKNDIPLKLAHPLKTKAIASAKIKTDKIDSNILAHLLRADLLPEAYIGDHTTRLRRELFRNRAFLVKIRNAIKGRIHAICAKLNIEPPCTDLFGKKGRKFLTDLDIEPLYKKTIARYLEALDNLTIQIELFSQEIKEEVAFDKKAQILMSIKGIGPHFALLILAEIGDIDRFLNAKKLVSFAGLCPSTYSSGGRTYHGKIIKQGSKWLRWAMIEAATKTSIHEPIIKTFYERLKKAKGAKKARVAVARKLLENIYHMLKKNETFEKSLEYMGQAC